VLLRESQNISNGKSYLQKEKGYGFTTEALFNSDIPLPEIKRISGKSKFLKTQKSGTDEMNLGYVVSIDVEKLDLEKVPQKYKTERKEKYKAGEFTVPPIEELVYEVSFEFELRDKDGFELVKLQSPSHSLYSGKANQFQGIAKQPILQATAERVVNIVLHMTVEKCETCR